MLGCESAQDVLENPPELWPGGKSEDVEGRPGAGASEGGNFPDDARSAWNAGCIL